MPKHASYLSLSLLTLAAGAQLPIHKISVPPGDTLQKAIRASMLGRPGAKPFHIRVEITETKGEAGDYKAAIEETWVSPSRWVRIVSGPHVTQKTVVDSTGQHIETQGDYYPAWLRDFVTGVFTPVPEPSQWNLANAPIEYIQFPNGKESTHCQHAEFELGVPSAKQINFANYCFAASGGLLELAQSPNYTVEFRDYASFGKLRVARTLVVEPASGTELTGRVTVLENVSSPPDQLFAVPAGATSSDPLRTLTISGAAMLQLAGGVPTLHWPANPGHGAFTSWVVLDRDGKVREAHSLNSDESGLAAEMTEQLVGLQWRGAVEKGVPVQTQGPIVFTYPPAASNTPNLPK